MIWMTLSVKPPSSLYFWQNRLSIWKNIRLSIWQNIRISICDRTMNLTTHESNDTSDIVFYFIRINVVYTTMGFVSQILFETQHELQKNRLQNNNTNETFSFFITQYVIKCLQF